MNNLPDKILLRIFSYLLNEDFYSEELCDQADVLMAASAPSLLAVSGTDHPAPPTCNDSVIPSTASKRKKKGSRKTGRKTNLAGPAARTLCRLCCCSKRLNHIASANQLWQPLTLSRFRNRHWPQTDPKKLELVRVQRGHQRKVAGDSQPRSSKENGLNALDIQGTEESIDDGVRDLDHGDDRDAKKQRLSSFPTTTTTITDITPTTTATATTTPPKRFYSRFEQRAFKRKFANLDPGLEYTPLLWTNTFWSWKRTYFGDCRFMEAQEVATPNRIDHPLHRKLAAHHDHHQERDEQKEKGEDAALIRDECSRCWRPLRSCICSALPKHVYCNCRTRVVILQHPRCQVSIGTIRILKTCFRFCDIFIGKDFSVGVHAELDKILDDPNCTPLLLFPSHDAIDIQEFAGTQARSVLPTSSTNYKTSVPSHFFCDGCTHQSNTDQGDQQQEPPSAYPYKTIIALDGSWSHAKILYRFNPRLQKFTSVLFPHPPRSIYHDLKPEPKATYTSTVEAVGQAVALLGWASSSPPLSAGSSQQQQITTTLAAPQQDNASLLLEDLMRPLHKMIEIQDTIHHERLKQ
ncbi:hypothetical protein DFQ26_005424 [Actinomortierella ambigua]|nr:hypothetical protein DFQ26_005424 [Actinomortierella ambigua]